MLGKVVFIFVLFYNCDCARILGIFPNPSISHQLVFRSIILELARRGHEVITVTPEPAFSNGTAPPNLTEINIHDVGAKLKNEMISERRANNRHLLELWTILVNTNRIMEYILENNELNEVIKSDKKIDLLIVESYVRTAIAFSKILNAPVALVSSFGTLPYQNEIFGIPTQPVLYPLMFQHKLYNLTISDKLHSIKFHQEFQNVIDAVEDMEYRVVKKICGDNHPTFGELYKNVKMLFLNNHPIWADSHPSALNYQFIGGVHKLNDNPLPKDIEDYLDSSKNGVIYASFGSNTNTSILPKMTEIVNVLSKMPYDILFKWDADFPSGYSNIKFFRWLPQARLLRHPKIRAFVTQGGLQSTDEAINAGVPLIAIPIYADQFYNAEKYVLHKIGFHLDLHSLTAASFKTAVETVINDASYKNNVLKLRSRVRDVPVKPLHTAIMWMEHIIQFGGDHLQPMSAHISWSEYYEIELILTTLACTVLSICLLVLLFKYIVKSLVKSAKYKHL